MDSRRLFENTEAPELRIDLKIVSKEEFRERVNPDEVDMYGSIDTESGESEYIVHYHRELDGLYLGSVRATDDGTEYLVPDDS